MNIDDINEKITKRFGINSLNDMQISTIKAYNANNNDLVLLSPTGSGKTLAFSASVLSKIQSSCSSTNCIIIAPSRELVIQITHVIRKIGLDIKVTECYGGHKMIDEINSLSAGTDIVVTTPGRLLDHINRKDINLSHCKQVVLDEFDKTLELGFEGEMKRILSRIPGDSRIILTSATSMEVIPDFLKLKSPETLNYISSQDRPQINVKIHEVVSDSKDKLATLIKTLNNITENSRTIIFVNYRDAALRVFNYLKENKLPVGIYAGSMDQNEREKAIELFNNGTFKILVSTDLASRGLDITDVEHIIHYHMPISAEAYVHRNGRTGRQNANGNVYIIHSAQETIPNYIKFDDKFKLSDNSKCGIKPDSDTLYFNAGRREKISKADIVGFLVAKTHIPATQIGIINSHDHYTLVAIPHGKASEIIRAAAGEKIKNQKIKISKATQQTADL